MIYEGKESNFLKMIIHHCYCNVCKGRIASFVINRLLIVNQNWKYCRRKVIGNFRYINEENSENWTIILFTMIILSEDIETKETIGIEDNRYVSF